MGLLDTLNNIFNGRKNANLLIVGLDNSGKTSIVKYMRPADTKMTTIAPTVGFTVEKFTAKGLNFTTFDMSGNLFSIRFKHFLGFWDQVNSLKVSYLMVVRTLKVKISI